jgi:Na+-translocating ferredoxin:NAD+ oxidoreductase subunit G
MGLALASVDENTLKSALPAADSFTSKTIDGMEYFEAKKGNDVVGYCLEISAKGYSGLIRMAVGIDTKGVIHDVEILENTETPGFGTRLSEGSFLSQFKGKSAQTVEAGKNIDAVSGATVSSKAVIEAINKTTGEFLKKIKK